MNPAARPPTRLAAASAAVMLFTQAASANNLFGVTVTAPGQTPLTVTGSSVFDIADDLLNTRNDFDRFGGTSFTGTLDYAGLRDAIIINGDAASDQVRLRIPSINFDRTFADEDEAERFLRIEGATTVARFINVVNRQTLVGVTDGNPAALTALLADDAFRNFGEFRNPFVGYTVGGDKSRLYASYGTISTDVGDGTLLETAFTGGIRFTDHVGLVLSLPAGYRDIEGSETFFGGAQLGLPIQFVRPFDGPVRWQVTPYGLAAAGGSQDQLAGGLIVGGGVVNFLSTRIGPLTLAGGQQVATYTGQPVEARDFRFETDVRQTLGRVSLQATVGEDGPIHLTGGVAYTRFFNDAAVQDYVSPIAGVGFRIFSRSVFRVGYRGDIGDGFDTHRGEIEFRFSH